MFKRLFHTRPIVFRPLGGVSSSLVQPIPLPKAPLLPPHKPLSETISCTILNNHGTIVAVSKSFPKMEFLKDHGLYPRDLRKIDTSAIDVIPSVIIRDNGFLVNLLHIKALVEADKVMIFDTSNPDAASKLGIFIYDLESKLQAVGSPGGWIQSYEHKALESILINVMTVLETEFQEHLESCGIILAQLEDEIDRDELRELLIKSKTLTAFYQKALLIRNVLDELLENDEDLEGIYLSDKNHRTAERTDFGEVEMLLEAYYKQCDEFVQQAESLINDIKSTEEIVNIILDANRNSLMLFELKVTIYTLGFTVATLLPAFYGMNLKNFIEESNCGFGGIVAFSIICGFIITSVNFKTLRAVQKLTLMGSNKKALKKKAGKRSWFKKWSKEERVEDNAQRDIVWKWLMEEKKK